MSEEGYLQVIGERLKLLRESKGMSQVEVCAKLNMDKSYLSAIENGRQNPSLLTFRSILQAMGENHFDIGLADDKKSNSLKG